MGSVRCKPKERMYIVLSPNVLQRLNENWIEIRRLSTSNVPKSVVVEEALKIAFIELAIKKEQSQFYTNVIDIEKKENAKKNVKNHKREQPVFLMSSQTIKEAHGSLEYIRSIAQENQITMKRVVEEALKLSFDEFELKKEDSQFYLNIRNLEETQNSIKQRKINYGARIKRINFKTSTQFLKQFREQFGKIQKLCGRKLKTSSIAEESIKIAIEDFDSRKQNSYLLINLIKKEEKNKKELVSFYISLDMVQLIEKKWLEIRQILNQNIPLLHMIEESLNIAIDDFKLKKEESQIYKRLCSAQKSLF